MNRQKWLAVSARKALFVFVGLVSLCSAATAQAPITEDDFIATWVGQYASVDVKGTFEITMGRDDEGKLACCSGWSKPEGGEASPWIVESVEFANGKVTITSFDPSGDVQLVSEAALEGSSLKGTYVARALADGSVIEQGTFTGTKQPSKSGS